MRIVHIGADSQFTQFLARAFEAVAPGENEYVVLSNSPELRNPMPAGTVQVVPASVRGLRAIRTRQWDCDLIVAHAMTAHAALAFSRASRTTRTVWSGWGYDYYETDRDGNLLGPLTRALVTELERGAGAPRRPLPRRIAGAAWNAYSGRLARRAAARSDFFSAPVPTDEAIFRRNYPSFAGAYAQLNYASTEEVFATPLRVPARDGNILIGNSAAPTNNHLEAFELLVGKDLGKRSVIVPLSYGDPRYRDAILKRGTAMFGNAFRPLVDRMPLAEYNELLATCSVVILNHRRQQAVGNVGTAFYSGATVYLDTENPLYEFLTGAGAAVRDTALLRDGSLESPLSDDEFAANRRVLDDFWGERRVHDNVGTLLASVRGES